MKTLNIIIAVAMALACAVAHSQEIDNYPDTTDMFYKHLNLKEVVVTGSTGETTISESATPVRYISAADLQGRSSTNIVDAISTEPGVSQITTGGGISKPVIRGLGYNRVVVVSNGVRQEGQQWGDEHGVEIDAADVNSVEILKGPASLVYGSDAMAGVIRFNSAPIVPYGKMRANFSAEYQTNNGLFGCSLNFAGNKGGNLWNVRYSEKLAHSYRNALDGYVPNSQFHERAVSIMGGVGRSWGHSHVFASFYHITPGIVEGERDLETGALEPGFVGNTSYRHGLPYQQVYHYKVVSDNSVRVGQGKLNMVLGYQLNRRQEFEESPSEFGLYLKLHTFNYNANYNIRLLNGCKLTAGIGGMYQKSVNAGSEFLVPDYRLFDFGTFVTAARRWGKWSVSSGVRYDVRRIVSDALDEDGDTRFTAMASNFGGFTGSVGTVLHTNEHLDLRANIASGFRSPNVSELKSNGIHEGSLRYEVGNANLKSERSVQFDLGMDWSTSIVSLQVSLFANLIDNFIYLRGSDDVYDADYKTFRYTGGDARLLGAEVSLDVHPLHCLHLGSSFSMVDARRRHAEAQEKFLPFTPAPRWMFDAKWEIVHGGRRTINNAYLKAVADVNFSQNHCLLAYGTETPTPAYTLINLVGGFDIMSRGKRVVSLTVSANNLANVTYQNHLSRLKYCDVNPITGRQGVSNMGRNIVFKVLVPLEF
ncbi:MAG: TonB-dependent receptor [Muribaculaceae bacterium]|nr:TonB-dependent receptor [Muribaculaceae bacterium]